MAEQTQLSAAPSVPDDAPNAEAAPDGAEDAEKAGQA